MYSSTDFKVQEKKKFRTNLKPRRQNKVWPAMKLHSCMFFLKWGLHNPDLALYLGEKVFQKKKFDAASAASCPLLPSLIPVHVPVLG